MQNIIPKDRLLVNHRILDAMHDAANKNAQRLLSTVVSKKGLILVSDRDLTPLPTGNRKFRLLPGKFVVKNTAGDWVIGEVPNSIIEHTVPLDGVSYNVWLSYATRQYGLGTVDVTGTAVTGTNTVFTVEYEAGDYIAFDGDPQASYKISSVDSDTGITLVSGPGAAETDSKHYLAGTFFEGTVSGSDTVYIQNIPHYGITLETDLNATIDNAILVGRIKTDATTLTVDLEQDYRLANIFEQTPRGQEAVLIPKKPLNVLMTTGVIPGTGRAWVTVETGWSGDTYSPGTLTVDISAAGETFTVDQLVGYYFQDSNDTLFKIESNNVDGSSITLDGTPAASGDWKIHPGAKSYELLTELKAYPPRIEQGETEGQAPPTTLRTTDSANVAFSPTEPAVTKDNYILGAKYMFKMRSYNGPDAVSEWSSFAQTESGDTFVLAGKSGVAPKAPTNLTISYNEEEELMTASWDVVTLDVNDDPVEIDSYELAYNSNGNGYVNPSFSGAKTQFNHYDLQPSGSTVSTSFYVKKGVYYEQQYSDGTPIPASGEQTAIPTVYVSVAVRAKAVDETRSALSTVAQTTIEGKMIAIVTAQDVPVAEGATN